MNEQLIQNEIINLEQAYWSAMKSGDVEKAVSLTKFPCEVSSPRGKMQVTEDQYRQMMKSHDAKSFEGAEVINPQVKVIDDNKAKIAYETRMQGQEYFDESTWVHENGSWKCESHSETPQTGLH